MQNIIWEKVKLSIENVTFFTWKEVKWLNINTALWLCSVVKIESTNNFGIVVGSPYIKEIHSSHCVKSNRIRSFSGLAVNTNRNTRSANASGFASLITPWTKFLGTSYILMYLFSHNSTPKTFSRSSHLFSNC